ncbi:hypothetical protein CRE_18458 [Caenorhabditis remanei]|uniref:Uncharacterized protein n=1 Tax=Caenorhabditis remanei TaxID=31234 RepID=E3LKL9_CAERE|nr:hypothetical protein CRE_18458 [Caenorhabditis remanei]
MQSSLPHSIQTFEIHQNYLKINNETYQSGTTTEGIDENTHFIINIGSNSSTNLITLHQTVEEALNRKNGPIKVDFLELSMTHGSIRLPKSLAKKLQVGNIGPVKPDVLTAFATIIDPRPPLDTLELSNVTPNDPVFQLEITKKSKGLEFDVEGENGKWLETIMGLENTITQINNDVPILNLKEIMELIGKWSKSDRKLGNKLSMTTTNKIVKEVSKLMIANLGAVSGTIPIGMLTVVDCTAIRMSRSLGLSVFGQSVDQSPNSKAVMFMGIIEM